MPRVVPCYTARRVFQPLLPYIQIPELELLPAIELASGRTDPITIKPFGTLVALGVWVSYRIVTRQARRLSLDVETMQQFFTWVTAGGFIGGHVFDVLLYHPDKVFHAKSAGAALQELLFIWRSQSSFGGFMGAFLGLLAWKHRFKVKDTLPFADVGGSAFVVGWVFGRLGCTTAHDHPGMRSDAWFAVQYPGGGRFDLGMYEAMFTLPLALTFLYLMRKPRPYGFYLGIMCTAYAPTRFAMDFLRAHDVRDPDPRHLGLTPAQWLCSALLGVGIYFLFKATKAAERGDVPVYSADALRAEKEPKGKHARAR